MALRIPSPVALTKPEAYLAYKAGILSRDELKQNLYNPLNNYEGWLAKWCGLLETYPTNKDGTPQCLADEEGLLAYLCGVTDRYPATNSRPDDARVSAYIRYLVSARYARPDHPLNREEFYLSLIKTQFIPSGDPSSDIVIDGTTKAPFVDVKLYGNATQTTYSGKNLFGWKELTFASKYYVASWSISNDGKLTVTPYDTTNSMGLSFYLPVSIASGATVTLSSKTQLVTSGLNLLNEDAGWAASFGTDYQSVTKTLTSKAVRISFSWLATGSTAPFTVDLSTMMIELGSSATSYEPFVGGIPAPNPDYPQPISVVTGGQTVKVVGKNLLDETAMFSTLSSSLTISDATFSGSACKKIERTSATTVIYPLNVNGQATLQFDLATESSSNYYIFLAYSDGTHSPSVTGDKTSWENITIVSDSTKTVTGIGFQLYTWSNVLYMKNLQLELGSQASDYQPYQAQSYEVNLGGNVLDIGTSFDDYFALDASGTRVKATSITSKVTGTIQDGKITVSTYDNSDGYWWASKEVTLEKNTNYTFSTADGTHARLNIVGIADFGIGTVGTVLLDYRPTDTAPATFNTGDYNHYVFTFYPATSSANNNGIIDRPMLQKGTTATGYCPYVPYQIELAKVGTYQDRIYKDGEKWYIEKQVGKTMFDGSQSFTYFRDATTFVTANYTSSVILRLPSNTVTTMSDKLIGATLGQTYGGSVIYGVSQASNGQYLQVSLKPEDASDAEGVKTFFSTHPTTVYYALATPTTTEITNQSLIDQLNALKQGGAEEGTTYIKVSATDPNLPAKLYVEAPKYD